MKLRFAAILMTVCACCASEKPNDAVFKELSGQVNAEADNFVKAFVGLTDVPAEELSRDLKAARLEVEAIARSVKVANAFAVQSKRRTNAPDKERMIGEHWNTIQGLRKQLPTQLARIYRAHPPAVEYGHSAADKLMRALRRVTEEVIKDSSNRENLQTQLQTQD